MISFTKWGKEDMGEGWLGSMKRVDNYVLILSKARWHPTPVLLPGKPLDGGARKAAVHGVAEGWTWLSWGSDTTERLHFHFSLSCIGEGNGNPLQYSCLENPRDRGAWWAVVYGVAQSRTRLKWLSKARSEGSFTYSKEYILIKILQKRGEGSRITSKF